MEPPKPNQLRVNFLRRLFRDVISGQKSVGTSRDAEQFFEAVRVNEPPVTCFESIIAGEKGLDAVSAAVRVNLDPDFIVAHTLPFLRYMSDPAIKSLADGQLLHRFLSAVVQPPTLWNTLVAMFKQKQIRDDDMFPFAWLAFQTLLLPAKLGIDLSEDLQAINEDGSLQTSQHHPVRTLGYKIKDSLLLKGSAQTPTAGANPGGRHDNDHADFRKIGIYPTTDEFLSTEQPFFRTSTEVSEAEVADRPGVHLDNQFRLLREDMLAELRGDIQVAIGAKKAKRTLECLGGLQPVALDVGDFGTRFRKCTVRLECWKGLQYLCNFEPGSRKKFLKDNGNYLKHQSFGVMLRSKEILGFAFLDRDIDLLAQTPPVLCLQFTDSGGLRKALMALKVQMPDEIKFVLVGTPVFAYEPVLKALKEINEFPLRRVLVEPASAENHSSPLNPELQRHLGLLTAATDQLGPDGSVLLPESIPAVHVDASQLQSMILALTKTIAVIQGPPGNSPI